MVDDALSAAIADLTPQLVAWRRDFHRYPEPGWCEFRTASLVAEELARLGFEVSVGESVLEAASRLGVPDEDTLDGALARARQQGAAEPWLAALAGGMTAVVGVLDSQRPGPTLAFRFDLDALPVVESSTNTHFPRRQGFASVNPAFMHACGHDGHTTIGLGLAHLLGRGALSFAGRIKLIFQPAEEGVRGAASIAAAGVVDDVDYFIAAHLGLGQPQGTLVCGADGFMATTKLDVRLTGQSAHAGGRPQEGRNALLAAAHATIGLHAIGPHGDGVSRLNVGRLTAGQGRNIIADTACLELETRGSSTAINDDMERRAREVIAGAAAMQNVEVDIIRVGAADNCGASPELVTRLADCLETTSLFEHIIRHDTAPIGSEDATSLMARTIAQGGQATYLILGTQLAAGHHHPCFDFDEATLPVAVESLARIVRELTCSS
ncbi:amidohydrolase [Kushneria aurantia]|uniref:Amidohydrolase n=1 Tax=Kushneria aurantia TaxID=504092 RepID=A0ABV6G5F8_9GAMM|nr:amidohydrolase [Kushneria aurantia]